MVEALAPVSSNVHVPAPTPFKSPKPKNLLGLKSSPAVNKACEERKTKRFVIYRLGILLPYKL